MALLEKSGLWQRAGMDGVISGLNWAAVQGFITAKAGSLDSSAMEALASEVETGFLGGILERKEKE